jgi:hypothetical protein
MTTAALSTKKMPLPVELFSGAMERQVSLADYARNIELHPDILLQALTGRLQGAHSHPVNTLAKAINRDLEQVDLTTLPCDESFSIWLKRNMEGISQHALRARAQLDSPTLKRFLNGDLLPDSDQAERISRALYIDRMEVARVITANMAASPSKARQESPEPRPLGRQSNASTKLGTSITAGQSVTGTRRRRASSRHTSAESASLPSTVTPTTINETASETVEPATAAAGTSPKVGKRLKRASKPEAQLADLIVAAIVTHQPHDENSSLTDTVDQAVVLTPPVPAKAATKREGGTRRPKQSTTHDLSNVAAAEQTSALNETKLAADDRPVGEYAAEDRKSPRARSGRRPKIIQTAATVVSTSGDEPSSFAAEIAPPKLDARSADISVDGTVPLVTAEPAADTTTLQLSADEMRLIRHWRQLHPHGRRATLQYIGSLLVDD